MGLWPKKPQPRVPVAATDQRTLSERISGSLRGLGRAGRDLGDTLQGRGERVFICPTQGCGRQVQPDARNCPIGHPIL